MPRTKTIMDQHIGNRLKLGRAACGLKQSDLAKILNVSSQQVQKYETGANRITASHLHQISTALNLPIHFFFEETGRQDNRNLAEITANQNIKVLRAFMRIRNPQVREQFFELAKELAEET